MDLICQLQDTVGNLEVANIQSLVDEQDAKHKAEIKIAESFLKCLRAECTVEQYYFSFFEVPDLVVKKQISKKDYVIINKVLNRIKRLFLAHKAQLLPDKPLD